MADPQVRISGFQGRTFEGTFNRETGKLDGNLVDLRALNIQGEGLTEKDINTIKARLADTTGVDTSGTKERIADKTETTAAKTTAPAEYTKSGRYTEAKVDGDLREGFRGDKVKAEQQRLKDQGYLQNEGGKEAVDGFWGPKTQAAYERFQADQKTVKGDTTKGDVSALRKESADRTKYAPVTDAKETAKELVQDIKAGNTDDINKLLTNTRNADMKEIDKALPRDKDGNYTTTLADVDGNDSDYADLGNRMLKGNRNEGPNAAANNKVVDEYADKLARSTYQAGFGWMPTSMNGTNEGFMNDVFSKASGAQLAELDRRLKSDGIRDSDGNVIKNSGGLRGLVEDEVGDGAHKKLLLAQLNRPLN